MTKKGNSQNINDLAKSLASVSQSEGIVEVLIFGAGIGGLAMLEVLSSFDAVSIACIVDISEDAPAFQLANELNIPTSTDGDQTLKAFQGSIVIDVTGDQALYKRLLSFTEPHHLELISAKSAKLLFDLANKELKNEKKIELQQTRMSMLDSMLEITLQLEHRPPFADIASRSFSDIYGHVDAVKGIAVMFNKKSDQIDFIGAIGEKVSSCTIPDCSHSACNSIRKACEKIKPGQRYKIYKKHFHLNCAELNTGYNVIIPLWQDNCLTGALLFDISTPLSKEQTTTLEMTSIHLNMTSKTLDHFQKLEEMAIFDPLTGVFNRRKFDMQLHHEVSRTKRSKRGSLTCGFIDLDDFKGINDTYGHPVGDQVLKHIGNSIESTLRDYDICARYGGDEFVVLIPTDNAIEGSGIEALGMRILANASDFHLINHPELKVSVSVGMVTQSCETVDAETLMLKADDALYQAKRSGKDCLRIIADEQFHLENRNQSGS